MESLPQRIVYAATVLILAAIGSQYVPWWVSVLMVAAGIVILIKPKWGGEDVWPS